MTPDTSESAAKIGTSFPLLGTFVFVLLPLLVIGGFGLGVTMIAGVSARSGSLFAQSDVRLVSTIVPRSSNDTIEPEPTPRMLAELEREAVELGFTCLSVVTPARSYTVRADEQAGCSDPDLTGFRHEIEEAGPLLVEDLITPNTWTSIGTAEPQTGELATLIAATRPATSLEASILRSAGTWAMVFASVIVLFVVTMAFVVVRAQKRIDAQARYVGRIHDRLRSFLPVAAVRDALGASTKTERLDAVILFADLRDFSGFADTNDTQDVAKLIDAFMTRTAAVVSGNCGEIDKIIGDGVLAVFRQPDAVAHAFDAALACIRACRDLERRPGVGLYRGEVVATAVGTSERADFTVLGRTVNLASRLCSLASEAEIVAPAGFADPLPEDVEEVSRETVTPRNHLLAEEVVRYRLRD
ncbi:adenylate/guanylate cyclase domain-containing protein [Fulvimarina sp. 2208YS6-2-32]|uniref:Adenylate/guanylate cyclase domain-containing protein n=1 Tax=Fulvimarina uroteuthidis TaxID=3098149 RepID=A0ABU5I683_9HYPH|nr:adenylate/guanylate cyclase domain-containing protein [Fulvimarina sp. 2208YS6-2-32]MDY8110872.1 adenylate/guanylate cyclase domain-containing protein [Fulvimarina sp. 2208YS6-2-32]